MLFLRLFPGLVSVGQHLSAEGQVALGGPACGALDGHLRPVAAPWAGTRSTLFIEYTTPPPPLPTQLLGQGEPGLSHRSPLGPSRLAPSRLKGENS